MLLSLVFLSSLLLYASGEITTQIRTHSSKSLQTKCDALPYRTVYFKTDCYIVVDVDARGAAANECSMALKGSKLAPSNTPDAVLAALFAGRDDFMMDGSSANQKKALCWYGPYGTKIVSDFPCAAGTPLSSEGTCTQREEEKNLIKYKLMLPHIAEFNKGIELEQTIVIKGTFSTYTFRSMTIPDMFEIHLLSNKDFHKTIPLQFKIDFPGNQVLLAHKHSSQWVGNKTKSASQFKMGEEFDIRIRIRNNHFQILVNQKEFATYKHVLPFETITHLWVDGRAFLTYVKLGETYPPVPRESASSTVFSQWCNTRTCGRSTANPFLPAIRTSPCSQDCTSLRISGTLNDYHTRPNYGSLMVLNLVRGNDFAISMDLRYWSGCAMGGWMCPHSTHTVLTWYKNRQWQSGDFELFAPLPIHAGAERFDLEIKNGAGNYEIWINGIRAYTFRHRTSPFDITEVEIAGIANLDVQVK